ncbi:hypothetical protein GCM10018773_16940 [Streptomyces candidus]|nr:hypothetical protein GCM10018773_16940 [Streptomyces candidus]
MRAGTAMAANHRWACSQQERLLFHVKHSVLRSVMFHVKRLARRGLANGRQSDAVTEQALGPQPVMRFVRGVRPAGAPPRFRPS